MGRGGFVPRVYSYLRGDHILKGESKFVIKGWMAYERDLQLPLIIGGIFSQSPQENSRLGFYPTQKAKTNSIKPKTVRFLENGHDPLYDTKKAGKLELNPLIHQQIYSGFFAFLSLCRSPAHPSGFSQVLTPKRGSITPWRRNQRAKNPININNSFMPL